MCIINVELARCGEEQLEFLLSSARNYNLRQSTENKIYKSYDDSVKLKRTEMDHFRLG